MKRRGLVGRSLVVMKHLGDAKRMRRRMRIVLLVGTAMFMVWSSPTTAQPTPGAVFPVTTAGTTNTIAIAGDATGTGQTGVVGHAWASSGVNLGVEGISDSTDGRGVRGYASAPSGATFGVIGRSDSPTGRGVFGNVPATSGINIGVEGITNSTDGRGVRGYASAPSGVTFGVVGRSDSTQGTGVFGNATNTSCILGPFPGGLGQTCVGVFGQSLSFRRGVGVFGLTQSADGAGVVGEDASGAGVGVFGQSSSGKGVLASSATGIGISAAGGILAGDFVGSVHISGDLGVFGNLSVHGTKSALVDTVSYGKRQLYTVESPESWFEDFGSAKLTHGRAIVTLDPIFAQTVNTEGYHIFLTPRGDCKGLYVATQRGTLFEVKELQNGKSSVAFDYRVVAKRKGYERARLPEPTK